MNHTLSARRSAAQIKDLKQAVWSHSGGWWWLNRRVLRRSVAAIGIGGAYSVVGHFWRRWRLMQKKQKKKKKKKRGSGALPGALPFPCRVPRLSTDTTTPEKKSQSLGDTVMLPNGSNHNGGCTGRVSRGSVIAGLIPEGIYHKYSVGPSIRSICTRWCCTMTNMTQVCSKFH